MHAFFPPSLQPSVETVEIPERSKGVTRLIARLRSCTKTKSSAIVIPLGIFLEARREENPEDKARKGEEKERKTCVPRASLNFPSCLVDREKIPHRQRPPLLLLLQTQQRFLLSRASRRDRLFLLARRRCPPVSSLTSQRRIL